MEKEIYLMPLLKLFLKKWWILLLCLIGGFVFTFSMMSFLIQDTYTSNVSLFFNYHGTINGNYENTYLNYSKSLANNSVVMLNSNTFYMELSDHIKNNAGQEYNWKSLQNKINYNVDEKTPCLDISINGSSSEEAYIIALNLKEIVSNYLLTTLDKDSKDLTIMPINTVEKALTPNTVNKWTYSILAGSIALIISVIVIYIVEDNDVRIKNKEDLKNMFNLPILATIPKVQKDSKNRGKNKNEGKM